MLQDSIKISLEKNPVITMNAIPGHFTTSNSHVNYYLDVSELRFNTRIAQDVARELALPYLTSSEIDTIVCMEKTAVVGGFIAQELLREGTAVMNAGKDIRVIIPTYNTSGKLVLPDNAREWITRKNVMLLVSSISSGRTVNGAIEFISYYGGNIAGVSSLFTAIPNSLGWEVNSLFTSDDVPGFKIYSSALNCEMCKSGVKLDALVSHEGYSII